MFIAIFEETQAQYVSIVDYIAATVTIIYMKTLHV